MRMVQPRDGTSLALEALAAVRLSRRVGRKHFDCDSAADPRVRRAINLAHPSAANEGDNFVRAQAGAG